MQINRILETGSQELANYLRNNTTGKRTNSPDGRVWTISGVETRTDIPPDPNTGKAVTLVILTIG